MDVLLNVCKERGISLGAEDLQWAFESPNSKADIEAWINEYVHHDTLLSRDELRM